MRKALAAVAVVAVFTVAAATNAAWAGTRHRHDRSRAPSSPSASRSATAVPTRSSASSAAASSSSTALAPTASAPTGAAPTGTAPAGSGAVFFDDFNYAGADDATLAAHGWSVRSGSGGPGVEGASWSKAAVTFAGDSATAGNTVMRLRATTGGSEQRTTQAEVSTTASKFFTGTYAARVYFDDAPTSGPDGDAVNQTFFTITPLRFDDDPIYSELDFEYLPNGGWGASRETMYLTSWYTYHNKPVWGGERATGEAPGSLRGWHDLVIQVADGTVRYLIDGVSVFTSTGRYYPRQAMSIDFNEWFIQGGLIPGTATRVYDERVDWVFHAAGQIVSPSEINDRIKTYRTSGVAFQDTVAR